MIVKELIALLEKLPGEWDISICMVNKAELVRGYSLIGLEGTRDFVYLPSEESEMLDQVVFDPLQLMGDQGQDLADWLMENKKPLVDFRDEGKDYRGIG